MGWYAAPGSRGDYRSTATLTGVRDLAAIPEAFRGQFLARGYMGLRPSEACRANVSDYVFSEDTLAVVGKGGRLRVLPADADVAAWIHEHVDARTAFKGAPLFQNARAASKDGRWSASSSRRMWLRACKVASIACRENEDCGMRSAPTK
jgi:integrase